MNMNGRPSERHERSGAHLSVEGERGKEGRKEGRKGALIGERAAAARGATSFMNEARWARGH